jgi:antirestriction protein ArdC
MNPATYRKDLTAQIIRQLETGTAPWQKPWNPDLAPLHGTPHNAMTERPYHGGNQLWLTCQGYADPRWCTYRQAKEQGWQVRKGEHSTAIEYWQWSERQKDEAGKFVEVKLDQPRVFYANVFNASQMENVPEARPVSLQWQPEEAAERILVASRADIRYDKTDTAFYSPRHDTIHLPPKVMFSDAQAFYGVALHELGHWSGHPSRLNRDLAHRFGSEGYAREELRAELASFFVASRLGIQHDPGQHAAYVDSWIKALQEDHNEIFRAAKDAEKITEFVLAFQQERTQHQDITAVETATRSSEMFGSPKSGPVRQSKKEVELEC